MDDSMRDIPQVERLLGEDAVASFIPRIGRSAVLDIVRRVLDKYRERAKSGGEIRQDAIIQSIVKNCRNKAMQKLQRVINGTGILIHTNLGRSPFGQDTLSWLTQSLAGYCNLEFHLPTEKRGRRGGFAEELIASVCGAEDALIVNNNASSIFLVLSCLAKGKEAIVSRGELVQIGGGFRIPDIMAETGSLLVEVGTTNITELEDYRNAVTPETAMIFSAHQSNFRIQGFARSPSLAELASLKSDAVIFVRDLGSGNLVREDPSLPKPFEATVQWELAQGPDIVCFSGDKLLGGCQAGIIAGRKDLIARLRKHPLMRILRVDKVTYFILQETLIRHDNKSLGDIGLWKIITGGRDGASSRISRLFRKIKHPGMREHAKRIATKAAFGGGTTPGIEVESAGIAIGIPGMAPEKIYSFFIGQDVPLIGTVSEGRYIIDFMAILDQDIPLIAQYIAGLISSGTGSS